jgi:ribonuclease P protein component
MSESGLQVMVTVSKKKFRQACQRNYIRRVMKEAVRKNKHRLSALLESGGMKCALAIVFTGHEKPSAAGTEAKIILLLQRLETEYEKLSG